METAIVHFRRVPFLWTIQIDVLLGRVTAVSLDLTDHRSWVLFNKEFDICHARVFVLP